MAKKRGDRLFLLLHGDGRILVRKSRPDENLASHLHGWMELPVSVGNAAVLSRAAFFSREGVDRGVL